MGKSSTVISSSISILTTVESHLTSFRKHLGNSFQVDLKETQLQVLSPHWVNLFDLDYILVNFEDDRLTDETD